MSIVLMYVGMTLKPLVDAAVSYGAANPKKTIAIGIPAATAASIRALRAAHIISSTTETNLNNWAFHTVPTALAGAVFGKPFMAAKNFLFASVKESVSPGIPQLSVGNSKKPVIPPPNPHALNLYGVEVLPDPKDAITLPTQSTSSNLDTPSHDAAPTESMDSWVADASEWLTKSAIDLSTTASKAWADLTYNAAKGMVKGVINKAVHPNLISTATRISNTITNTSPKYQLLGGVCGTLAIVGIYRYFKPASLGSRVKIPPQHSQQNQQNLQADRLMLENEQLKLGLSYLQKELEQRQTPPPAPAQPVIFKQYFTGAQPQAPEAEPSTRTQSKKSELTPSVNVSNSRNDENEPEEPTSISIEVSNPEASPINQASLGDQNG